MRLASFTQPGVVIDALHEWTTSVDQIVTSRVSRAANTVSFSWARLLSVGVLLAALMLGARVMALPAVVPHVHVVNPTAYDLVVEVSDDAGASWMPLTTVFHTSSDDVRDVIDQGASWRFRFSSQGVAGGEVTVSGDELRQHNWVMSVPSAVDAQLTRSGAPRPPTRP